MDRFEYYKNLYNLEEEKRIKLNDSLNMPFAIITIIGAIIYTFLTNFKFAECNLNTISFIVIIILSIIALIISIYYMILSYEVFTRFQYEYLPYPDSLEEYYSHLEEMYSGASREQEGLHEHLFETELIERYVRSCSVNSSLNDRKSGFLHRGKRFLIISLILILIAFIPFIINYFYHINLIIQLN